MGINIADNFQYQSQKPLDGRTKYDTTAAMKAVPDSSMYDGCLAYCSGTDKTYQWKSSNSVDATLGRWREFATGGTDSNAYHTSDATGSAIVDDDYFPFYDTSVNTKKKSTWANLKSLLKTYFDTLYNYTLPTATSSVLGGVKIGENMLIEDGVINPSYLVVANKFNKSDIYFTTEKVVGCWTDGRPIYQKTLAFTMPTTSTDGTLVASNIAIGASVENAISAIAWFKVPNGNVIFLNDFTMSGSTVRQGRVQICTNSSTTSGNKNTLQISNGMMSWNDATGYATIQYTKATDAANSFNYADENDYSTSEKIIGKWIDGSNLYQITNVTSLQGSSSAETDTNLFALPSGVKNIVSIVGVAVDVTNPFATFACPCYIDENHYCNFRASKTLDYIKVKFKGLADTSHPTDPIRFSVTVKYTKT